MALVKCSLAGNLIIFIGGDSQISSRTKQTSNIHHLMSFSNDKGNIEPIL